MNKNVEVLKLAKSYIDKPEKWTKGMDARDKNGRPVLSHDPNAVCFCTMGAIRKAAKVKKVALNRPLDIIRPIISLKTGLAMGSSITDSNDRHGTTHEMVMEAFDKAIEQAE